MCVCGGVIMKIKQEQNTLSQQCMSHIHAVQGCINLAHSSDISLKRMCARSWAALLESLFTHIHDQSTHHRENELNYNHH